MEIAQVEDAAELIQMEYAEMPGLKLTFWQARRLWNLSEDLCERAFDRLTVEPSSAARSSPASIVGRTFAIATCVVSQTFVASSSSWMQTVAVYDPLSA